MCASSLIFKIFEKRKIFWWFNPLRTSLLTTWFTMYYSYLLLLLNNDSKNSVSWMFEDFPFLFKFMKFGIKISYFWGIHVQRLRWPIFRSWTLVKPSLQLRVLLVVWGRFHLPKGRRLGIIFLQHISSRWRVNHMVKVIRLPFLNPNLVGRTKRPSQIYINHSCLITHTALFLFVYFLCRDIFQD